MKTQTLIPTRDYVFNNPEQGLAVLIDLLSAEDSILIDHIKQQIKGSWNLTRDEVQHNCIIAEPVVCLRDNTGRIITVMRLYQYLSELSIKAQEYSPLERSLFFDY
ncbi:MAG: hypothetical protein ABII22_04635 [Candidatus Micrarchaeota archaeon]